MRKTTAILMGVIAAFPIVYAYAVYLPYYGFIMFSCIIYILPPYNLPLIKDASRGFLMCVVSVSLINIIFIPLPLFIIAPLSGIVLSILISLVFISVPEVQQAPSENIRRISRSLGWKLAIAVILFIMNHVPVDGRDPFISYLFDYGLYYLLFAYIGVVGIEVFMFSKFSAYLVICSMHWVQPKLYLLNEITPYLKVLGPPLIIFSVIYFVIIVFFAFCAVATYRYYGYYGRTAFHGLPLKPTFLDFFYYSAITMTTVGYGDIYPLRPLTKLLSNLEVVLGLGWFTVGFAAIVAYVQPQFTEIANRHRQ